MLGERYDGADKCTHYMDKIREYTKEAKARVRAMKKLKLEQVKSHAADLEEKKLKHAADEKEKDRQHVADASELEGKRSHSAMEKEAKRMESLIKLALDNLTCCLTGVTMEYGKDVCSITRAITEMLGLLDRIRELHCDLHAIIGDDYGDEL